MELISWLLERGADPHQVAKGEVQQGELQYEKKKVAEIKARQAINTQNGQYKVDKLEKAEKRAAAEAAQRAERAAEVKARHLAFVTDLWEAKDGTEGPAVGLNVTIRAAHDAHAPSAVGGARCARD